MATPTVQNQGYNVKNAADEPFFMLVHWACQSVTSHDQVSLKALDVLREMKEEIIDTGSTVQLSLRLDVTLPMATELLTSHMTTDNPLMKQHCLKLLKVVEFLRTLCIDENSRQYVAQCLDVQVVLSILECQLNHNQIGLSMTRKSNQSDWR
ncbi:uncharacterized protein LOC117120994 [Anneissia japonica]|uniref:uncharacterized protein LOC117120994 n=1 Tax=Anneissia japonica TaxID=1529436 RepID=UPI0014259B03|nr:uncharacterized protein LOC117120994 [Anneissia japonica]